LSTTVYDANYIEVTETLYSNNWRPDIDKTQQEKSARSKNTVYVHHQ